MIENGQYDRKNNPLKNAPHSQHVFLNEKWTLPYPLQRAVFPIVRKKHTHTFVDSVFFRNLFHRTINSGHHVGESTMFMVIRILNVVLTKLSLSCDFFFPLLFLDCFPPILTSQLMYHLSKYDT